MSQPETVPPVDTANAPDVIDLTGVPANDAANVPDTVGAGDHLPDDVEVGPPSEIPPVDAGIPSEIPAAEQAPATAGCAANAGGSNAAACAGT